MDATYTKKQGYAMLVKRWSEGESYPTMYHLILSWIEHYKDTIYEKKEMSDILKRMINGDEMKVIVEDVMYGQRYLLLRIEMSYT